MLSCWSRDETVQSCLMHGISTLVENHLLPRHYTAQL